MTPPRPDFLHGVRLLRGRVLLRRHPDVKSVIILPDIDGKIARKLRIHKGTVLDMGEPTKTRKGVDVPREYAVGDEVLFVYALATEKFRTFPEDVVLVHHEEIQAVIE